VQAAPSETQVDSFTQVFHRMAPTLYTQALAILADPSAAEDVVQDAFVRVWSRRERLHDPQRLDGYLATAARHLALDRLRRGQRVAAKQLLVAKPALLAERAGPDVERIDRALQRLPAEQREVVVLRVHTGLDFAEIARRTDAPLGTVHSRYRYAMTRLRESLAAESRHD
jgi:RNA polymerase sigma-70 factor (ECF subfamily)